MIASREWRMRQGGIYVAKRRSVVVTWTIRYDSAGPKGEGASEVTIRDGRNNRQIHKPRGSEGANDA
jgi:hypothetical protein